MKPLQENKRYRTLVVDPPWYYDKHGTMPGNAKKTGHKAKRELLPYDSLSLEQIEALPVGSLADRDALLFLWTTNRYLPASFAVARAWGFQYRQVLVWHKTGNPSPFGGTVAPNHAEFLLVAAKGSPPIPSSRLPSSVIAAQKPYEHSRKPEVFLDLIEQVGPRPWVELFARRARFGWDYWGDQSLGTAEMAA